VSVLLFLDVVFCEVISLKRPYVSLIKNAIREGYGLEPIHLSCESVVMAGPFAEFWTGHVGWSQFRICSEGGKWSQIARYDLSLRREDLERIAIGLTVQIAAEGGEYGTVVRAMS
jgi:hypothetical protein